MLLARNKALLLAAAALVGVWIVVYFVFIQTNWARAGAALSEAQNRRENWEKYAFRNGPKYLNKKEADALLKENNEALARRKRELERVEFGSREGLKQFTQAAAGDNDPKNYLATMLKQTLEKAKQAGIAVPPELSLFDRGGDESVSLSLMRLALADRLLAACSEAKVPKILKLVYQTPAVVPLPDEDPDADEAKADTKKDPGVERLVQFPVKITIKAPEKIFGQFLFELQRPSDFTHGYFSLKGFELAVRDPASGQIDATVIASGLLKESDVKAYGIELKKSSNRGSGSSNTTRKANLQRGGY